MARCAAILFLACAFSAHADPLLTSWVTGISSKYARIYTSTTNRTNGVFATTWSGMSISQASPAYAGVNQIDSSANWVYIFSTGMGAHVMGPWSNPNVPKNQQFLWRFPRTPSVPTTNRTATSASPTTATSGGAIGFFVDGVAAFNITDGFSYSNSNSEDASPITSIGNGDGIWNRDAFVNEAVSFDFALAHNQQNGQYHYHVNPLAVRYLTGDNVLYNSSTKVYSENTATTTFAHSPLLGWMKDGLPIYGPYGYDGGGLGATATATRSGTSVATISVTASGTYFFTPAVSFSGGSGSGATATASMKVLAAVVNTVQNSSAGGTGYKVGDTLTVTGGSSTVTATLTVATISGTGSTGAIATLTVAQAGSYTVIPPNYVSVTGGTGSGAVPILTWGVNAIAVTNGGSGYTSAPTVTIGGVRRMISGYQLRDGTNGTTNLNTIVPAVSSTTGRTSLPGWALTSQGRAQLSTSSQYGPVVGTTYALGHYWEDYDYLGDLGFTQGSLANSGSVFFDLDVYNTRFCITPDYPNGTWAYFTTIKADGTSYYPYEVGRWYRGNPNTGGGSTTSTVMNADTPLTQQFLGGANTAITIGTPNVSGGTVTLTWTAVEGGAYSVSASPDDSTWTSEKTGLTPSNVPTAPTVGNQSVTASTSYTALGTSGTEYGEVVRTALATYDSAGQTASTVSQTTTISYLDGTPGALSVSPSTSFSSSGLQGGAFSPSSDGYQLTNTGANPLTWTAGKTTNWLSLDNTGGTLGAGASITVNASINSNANSLSSGSYSDTLSFANSTNGSGNTTRAVSLTVNALTALQSWMSTWYSSTSNSGNAAYLADPYSTGIDNLMVFAYLGPNQNPAHAVFNQLPQPLLSGGNYYFSFTQPTGVSGITYGAQWSTTLKSGSWTPITDTGSGTQHIFSVPVGSNTAMFLQLTATSP